MLTELNSLGIAFILWVQSLYPPLDSFFKTINFLQTEEFFLLALPIVWWCIDKRIGASLAVLFLLSDYSVRLLKGITNVTRPYDAQPRIRNLDPQADPSFPSAGAMDTTIFWVYLAALLRSRIMWILAVVLVVVMAFTRVYLGAHYPTDVVASVILGAAIIAVAVGGRVADLIAASPRAAQWVLAVAVPLALAWIRLNTETAVTLGALLGFGIGLILEAQWIRFEPRNSMAKQVAKVLIGLIVGLGIRFALKPLLPPGDLFTMVRYAIIGLWMGVGAPWAFVALRLADSTIHKPTAPEPSRAAL
jgi:membrane-associated phospholipid phosphatase